MPEETAREIECLAASTAKGFSGLARDLLRDAVRYYLDEDISPQVAENNNWEEVWMRLR